MTPSEPKADQRFKNGQTGPFFTSAPSGEYSAIPRPWVRYFARVVDGVIAIMLATFILMLTSPAQVVRDEEGYGVAIFALFFWIFAETLLLSTYGTTPGKALLSTCIRTTSGGKPRLGEALSRCFRVWFFGLGIGFPIISFFTMIAGYNHLSQHGVTSWDRATNSRVLHAPIGVVRTAITICVAALSLLLLAIFHAGISV